MVLIVIAGCAGDGGPAPETGGNAETPEEPGNEAGDQADQRYPDVVDAELSVTGDGSYEIAVTISSPYDSPERYADGWRVLDPQGEVLAEHVTEVTIEGRDLEHGYGGETVTVDVPR